MRAKQWVVGIWMVVAFGVFAYVAIGGGYGLAGERIRIRFVVYAAIGLVVAVLGIVSRLRDRRRGAASQVHQPFAPMSPAQQPSYAWPPEQYALQQAARVSPWAQPVQQPQPQQAFPQHIHTELDPHDPHSRSLT